MSNSSITKQVLYVLGFFICITEIMLLIVPLTASPKTAANFSMGGWLGVTGAFIILVTLYLSGVMKNRDKSAPLFTMIKHMLFKSIPSFTIIIPVALLSYINVKYHKLLEENPDAIPVHLRSLVVLPLIGQTIVFLSLLMKDLGSELTHIVSRASQLHKSLFNTILILALSLNFIFTMFFSVMQYYSVTKLATDGFTSSLV